MRPRTPSLMRAVLAALFLQLAATVYAVASVLI
jgi:hypothetical protein